MRKLQQRFGVAAIAGSMLLVGCGSEEAHHPAPQAESGEPNAGPDGLPPAEQVARDGERVFGDRLIGLWIDYPEGKAAYRLGVKGLTVNDQAGWRSDTAYGSGQVELVDGKYSRADLDEFQNRVSAIAAPSQSFCTAGIDVKGDRVSATVLQLGDVPKRIREAIPADAIDLTVLQQKACPGLFGTSAVDRSPQAWHPKRAGTDRQLSSDLAVQFAQGPGLQHRARRPFRAGG